MSELRYECELIQDLLPLYQDGVCSDSSKKVVENHLKDCGNCRKVAQKLKNFEVDELLAQEKSTVLMTHEKKERRRTLTAGIATACILMIPVIVCLICNIAIGHGLDWFFIVFASILVAASLTVLPLLVQNKRGLWTIGGFTCTLLLLLMVCAIYARGNWFWIAAVSCILGISVFLAPYVVCNIPLPQSLRSKKGLLVMCWDTLWLYGLLIACGLTVRGGAFYWHASLLITTYCLWLPWFIFGICRYLKANVYTKAGIIVMACGIFAAFTNDVVGIITGVRNGGSIFNANIATGHTFYDWEVVSGNILLSFLILSILAGSALIIAGMRAKRRNKVDSES